MKKKTQSKQAAEWAAKIAAIYASEHPNEKLCENWSELAYSECHGSVYFYDWQACHDAIAAEL